MSHFQRQPGKVYILIFILQMKNLRLRGLQSLAKVTEAGIAELALKGTSASDSIGSLSGQPCLCGQQDFWPQPHVSAHTSSWAEEEGRRLSSWTSHLCCQSQRERKKKQNTLENYSLPCETNLHNHFLFLIPQTASTSLHTPTFCPHIQYTSLTSLCIFVLSLSHGLFTLSLFLHLTTSHSSLLWWQNGVTAAEWVQTLSNPPYLAPAPSSLFTSQFSLSSLLFFFSLI